jgi:hypothetical protein
MNRDPDDFIGPMIANVVLFWFEQPTALTRTTPKGAPTARRTASTSSSNSSSRPTATTPIFAPTRGRSRSINARLAHAGFSSPSGSDPGNSYA